MVTAEVISWFLEVASILHRGNEYVLQLLPFTIGPLLRSRQDRGVVISSRPPQRVVSG
jgi:hypothetical protein